MMNNRRSTAFTVSRRNLRRSRRIHTWKNKDLWSSIYAHLKSRKMRRRLVTQPWIKPAVALQLAATIIQSLWRGSLQRIRIQSAAKIGMDQAAAKGLNNVRRGSTMKNKRGTIHLRYDSWRHVHENNSDFEHKVDREVMFRDWVATRIQSWFRSQIIRWRYVYGRFSFYHIAASVLQDAWRARITYLSNMGFATEHSRRVTMKEQNQQQYQQNKMGFQTDHHYHQHHQKQEQVSDIFADISTRSKPVKRKPGVHSIQNAWRRYTSRRIFQYYRDLIKFRNAGNPALMLRSINPREASLFDEAAGIVLRFRLGGASFPPLIYYKIFTKAPLCDVNAFAPRDYVKSKMYHNAATVNNWNNEESKRDKEQRMSRLNFHKKKKVYRRGGDGRLKIRKMKNDNGIVGSGSIRVGRSQFATKYADEADIEDRDGEEVLFAYEREENNGWRSVTLEVLVDADEDPIKKKIRKMQSKFHYSRQVRKEDKMIARKQKKRKWMMKMYREGLAKERPEVLAAAAGRGGNDMNHGYMKDHLEVDFNGDHWEEEAENLLEWSETLDFDSYLNDWKQIGTSTNQRSNVNHLIDDLSRSSLFEDSSMGSNMLM
jgi:hypothetical protein